MPSRKLDDKTICSYNVITMKSSIIKIGNSRGLRIPKVLLEESGISGPVIITAKSGVIKILPDDEKLQKLKINEEALLSEKALAKDWLRPEEEEAWKAYQQEL